MGRGVRHKLQLPVTVPLSVDLSPFASPEIGKCCYVIVEGWDSLLFIVAVNGGKKNVYELYGIVNHSGSLDFGHYTADIKHFALQKWYHCNDAS